MGARVTREGTYVYLWLIPVVVWQKPTQLCKAIIIQFKIIFFKKTKINKWDLIKLKSICTAKEIIDKTKRHPTEWEKIFTGNMTDKELISKLYKHFSQLSIS